MNSRFTLSVAAALVAVPLVAVSLTAQAGTTSSAGSVEAAEQTTATLAGALVSAVVSVSDVATPDATPSEIRAAFETISLLLPECQDTYELIDATGSPLDQGNLPSDILEIRALQELVDGAPSVQGVVGNDLRTFLPLTSDMHPNCMTCHSSYAGLPSGTVVGALSLKVGI